MPGRHKKSRINRDLWSLHYEGLESQVLRNKIIKAYSYNEAEAGVEPANGGFAVRSVSPLHHSANPAIIQQNPAYFYISAGNCFFIWFLI